MVHAFSKDVAPKVDAIARLELELAYLKAAVKHFNHEAIRTPSSTYFDWQISFTGMSTRPRLFYA